MAVTQNNFQKLLLLYPTYLRLGSTNYEIQWNKTGKTVQSQEGLEKKPKNLSFSTSLNLFFWKRKTYKNQ